MGSAWLRITLATIALFIFSPSAFAQFRFSVTDLAPSLHRARALAINDDGTVAGMYGEEEVSQSFLWSPTTGLQLLPPLPQSNITRVYDLNNPGQLLVSDDGGHFVIFENNAYTPLPVQATSINDHGDLAGTHEHTSPTSPSTYTAFRWSAGSEHQLPLPSGSENGFGIGINNAGDVVGGVDSSPALWESNDTIHILSTDGQGYAYDVNRFLWVAGNHGSRAFVWTPTAGLEDLDHHPAGLFGSTDTALAINDVGHAVGYSEILPNENDLAFFWTADEKMMDLNALLDSSGEGWTLQVAWDINNHDQIVGYGIYNGQQRAFLLTPTQVPEPFITLATIPLACLLRRPRHPR